MYYKYIVSLLLFTATLQWKALSLTRAIPASWCCHVPNCLDAFRPLNDFLDRASQHIWWWDRFVPDRVMSSLLIETSLTIDVNIELESDIMVQARKDHAIGYRSSPDFDAFDNLESFEYFIKYVYRCTFRRWKWKMSFWMLQRFITHWWGFWTEIRVVVDFSLSIKKL
jgi:hypothetical protein